MPRLPFAFLIFLSACASQPTNPSFPITNAQAQTAIHQMRADPLPLPRPVVLIGGFLDPGLVPAVQKSFFQSVSRNTKFIPVTIGFCDSFAECRAKVIATVDAACPSTDPTFTTEVDVIGSSLGGLTARFVAAPSPDPTHPRRLKIARLFAISSPQTGSIFAKNLGFTDFHRQMRPDSHFLKNLASFDAGASYQLYSYVFLDDEVVGARYAAPPKKTPFWLANPNPFFAHHFSLVDDRILADIARHLRNEPSFSHFPAAPIPAGKVSNSQYG